MKLEKKFGKTSDHLEKALHKLRKNISTEFKKAKKEEKSNHEIIMEDYKDDVTEIMNKWDAMKLAVTTRISQKSGAQSKPSRSANAHMVLI